jgi:hypothetical protein
MRFPPIPLLIFAAIDIVLALFLLLADGFSAGFFIIAAIGVLLAALGLRSVRSGQP